MPDLPPEPPLGEPIYDEPPALDGKAAITARVAEPVVEQTAGESGANHTVVIPQTAGSAGAAHPESPEES